MVPRFCCTAPEMKRWISFLRICFSFVRHRRDFRVQSSLSRHFFVSIFNKPCRVLNLSYNEFRFFRDMLKVYHLVLKPSHNVFCLLFQPSTTNDDQTHILADNGRIVKDAVCR